MHHIEHFFVCSACAGEADQVHQSSPPSRFAARGPLPAVETMEQMSLLLREWNPRVDVADTIWPISDSGLAKSRVGSTGWRI